MKWYSKWYLRWRSRHERAETERVARYVADHIHKMVEQDKLSALPGASQATWWPEVAPETDAIGGYRYD